MPEGLHDTLSWVQAFVRDDAEPDENEINDVLAPSSRMCAADRLQILRDQYWGHIKQTLAKELPVTLRFMGQEAFNTLMWHYVRACPLRTYSSHHLKQELPNFLLSTDDFKYRSFIREVSILEIACHEIRWAAPSEKLTADAWPGLAGKKRPPLMVESHRLLAFHHRVLDFVEYEGEFRRADWGYDIAPNWLLVLFADDRLTHWRLEEEEYVALTRLRDGKLWSGAEEVIPKWLERGLFAASP